jgi:hypothetical protein
VKRTYSKKRTQSDGVVALNNKSNKKNAIAMSSDAKVPSSSLPPPEVNKEEE